MDAAEIRRLKPKLHKYLGEFRDCFGRSDTRGHLDTYVTGQLSKLDRKSVEPIALAAGVPPRTLQQFLNSLEWDQEQLIDTLQWRVARAHTSQHSIGIIDETSCPKKGDKTPGVQRQWCGATAGQSHLSLPNLAQHVGQKLIVHDRLQLFAADAPLARLVVLQKGYCQPSQQAKVFGTVILAKATLIFIEGHIQQPV